jgi:DNA polymerase-3 subunit beta
MKVVFDRQPLASGIALIQNIVSATTTMPILSSVLIESEGEQARICGTDLEAFGQVQMTARVEESGRAAAPARLLGDIVKRLPDGDVTLETTGARMTIASNRNLYQLTTMPADDFPDWPRVEPRLTLVLRQADLKRVLHNTMFAIPARDPRKVLMGVNFDFQDGRLTCVATDGRKLGKTILEPLEARGEARGQAIIPERILGEIDHAIGEEGEIELAFGERQILFKLSNLSYVSNLIEGSYPKYDAFIPQSFTRTIKIQKTTLADAIARAAILAERKHHSIILKFSSQKIEIESKDYDMGSFKGEVETDYDGEPFKIAFNHNYLQEIFKVTPDVVLDMKLKESNAPVVFEVESDPDTLYLVMPVRMADLDADVADEVESRA